MKVNFSQLFLFNSREKGLAELVDLLCEAMETKMEQLEGEKSQLEEEKSLLESDILPQVFHQIKCSHT